MSTRPIEPGPQPLDLIVRKGGLNDLGAVLRIMRSAFDPRFGEGWNRDQCAGILPMPGVQLDVAVVPGSGETLGFALSRTIADESELLLIAVEADAQGRGVGGILLEAFLDMAETRGAHRIHLEVRDGNPAIALYEGHRFVIAGRRRDYYKGTDGVRYDALTLVRSNSQD